MKKVLIKGLLVLFEAGIAVLAERIKKRRNRHVNSERTQPLQRQLRSAT